MRCLMQLTAGDDFAAEYFGSIFHTVLMGAGGIHISTGNFGLIAFGSADFDRDVRSMLYDDLHNQGIDAIINCR